MATVKALVSFSTSTVCMFKGQEGEVSDKALLKDLLKAKYVEELKKPSKRR